MAMEMEMEAEAEAAVVAMMGTTGMVEMVTMVMEAAETA
jgi:hypothetical protein